MNLPSVIVSMVLFAICLPVFLNNHSRAAATIWNAKAEQQAVAVSAWHAASRLQKGCPANVDADNDGDFDDPTDYWQMDGIDGLLPGDDFLPHEGFSVVCKIECAAWPPTPTPAPHSDPPCADSQAEVLTVTTTWEKLNGTERSFPLSILKPPS